MYSGTVF